VHLIGTTAALIGGLRDAPNRSQRAIDQAHDLPHRDLRGLPRQAIASELASLAPNEATAPQILHDLLEKLRRNLFLLRNLPDAKQVATHLGGDSEVDQSPEGILAFLRKFHPITLTR
jgi:hypothetical protein